MYQRSGALCKYLLGVSLLTFSALFLRFCFVVIWTRLYIFSSSNKRAMKIAKGKEAARTDKKEALFPVEDRSSVGKRKAALKAKESTKKRAKKEKIVKKDPNKPKKPPSAFFVFLEEFRKIYKQEHPNVKAVSAVGKAGGEKWKSMSASEKSPYEAKAAKRKSDYEKLMTAYNKKQETDDGGDEDEDVEQSDWSKFEVSGQDDDIETEEEDEEDEDDE